MKTTHIYIYISLYDQPGLSDTLSDLLLKNTCQVDKLGIIFITLISDMN